MKINPSQFLPSQEQPQARYIPSYLQNQCQCELCAYQYDLGERVPMMLCGSQHNCCLVCVKQIIIRKNQCPFCRSAINIQNVHKNRMLCKILQQAAKRKGLVIKINENPQKQFIQSRKSFIIPQGQNLPPDVNIDVSVLIQANQLLNQYHALVNQRQRNESCCLKIWNRIQLKQPLYCFAYFLVMFYNFPFFICELNYAFNTEQQSCLDTDYGVGMSLRTWLLSSGLIGLSMYGLQLLVILWKICFPTKKKLPQSLTIMNIIFFLLKYLGYNTLGFVVEGNIDQDGLSNCNGSVLAYMEALFIIQIVIVCGLCSLAQRKGR